MRSLSEPETALHLSSESEKDPTRSSDTTRSKPACHSSQDKYEATPESLLAAIASVQRDPTYTAKAKLLGQLLVDGGVCVCAPLSVPVYLYDPLCGRTSSRVHKTLAATRAFEDRNRELDATPLEVQPSGAYKTTHTTFTLLAVPVRALFSIIKLLRTYTKQGAPKRGCGSSRGSRRGCTISGFPSARSFPSTSGCGWTCTPCTLRWAAECSWCCSCSGSCCVAAGKPRRERAKTSRQGPREGWRTLHASSFLRPPRSWDSL